MKYVFRFPDIGEGIAEGQIMQWHVSRGQKVKAGDPLVEVETDKVVTDIPSPRDGVILQLFGAPGDTIAVEAPLVELEIEMAEQTPASDGQTAMAEVSVLPAPKRSEAIEEEGFGVVGTIEAAGDGAFLPSSREGLEDSPGDESENPLHRGLATPVARALARHMGIDIARVRGTGPAGRVTKKDIQRHAEGGYAIAGKPAGNSTGAGPGTSRGGAVGPGSPGSASGPGGPGPGSHGNPAPSGGRESRPEPEYIALTPTRRAIAANMIRSKTSAAHMTVTEEADASRLMALYREYRDEYRGRGIKLTLLAFIIKAVVRALAAHPDLNSQFDDEQGRIIRYRHYDMGIAVDAPRGLLVPVIRNADRLGLGTTAKIIEDLAARARENRLTAEDLQGGTFTITNFGSIGGIFATPVINYPQAAILGIGRLLERPVVRNGELVPGLILPLSLSADHRIIDGGEATRFINSVRGYLENPVSIFMD